MDTEEIINEIGGFGLYQKFQLFLFCVPWIGGGLQIAQAVFILRVPDFRCAIPGWDNDTFEEQSATHAWYVNHSFPSNDRKCKVYQFNSSNYDLNSSKVINCDSWVFDKSDGSTTASAEMNLVCDRSVYISIVNMILMAGVFCGSIIFGILSDQKGRKISLYISLLLSIAAVTPMYFVNSLLSLGILRFMAGASGASIYMTAFILAIEMVPHSHRSFIGLLCHIVFASGQIIMAGIAYFEREWHLLSLCSCLILIPISTYWFLIDESPRWLISKGKYEKAKEVLGKIARRNKCVFTSSMLQKDPEIDTSKDTPVKSASLKPLITSKILLLRSFVLSFNWFVINLVFYGLLFGVGELGLNIYLSTCLFAFAEFPAYIILYFTMDRLGRKPVYTFSIFLCATACISSSFAFFFAEDLFALTIFLALLGKFGVAGASTVIANIASELLPTVVRNSAFGLISCIGRLGAMSAPYILLLRKIMPTQKGESVPLMFFGVAALIAGFLSLILPETLGKKLPDTIEEGEQFGRKKKGDIQVNVVSLEIFRKLDD
ncbi:organic cation transporter protein-like [Argonauta hians]